jgi:hypothetical protein
MSTRTWRILWAYTLIPAVTGPASAGDEEPIPRQDHDPVFAQANGKPAHRPGELDRLHPAGESGEHGRVTGSSR